MKSSLKMKLIVKMKMKMKKVIMRYSSNTEYCTFTCHEAAGSFKLIVKMKMKKVMMQCSYNFMYTAFLIIKICLSISSLNFIIEISIFQSGYNFMYTGTAPRMLDQPWQRGCATNSAVSGFYFL